MTKRRTTYGGQLPRTSDGMQPQRNTMVSMARLIEDLLLGQSDPAGVTYPVLVAGFKPSYAGNMTVDFTAGRVYERDDVDAVAWGGLGTDTRQIYHQGEAEASTLTFAAAPATVGHSRIDLVQVIRAEVDENGAVLGYYNSAKPSEPLNGPANSGTSQAQDRTQKATLAIKQGTSGASPVAPTADAGYTALYTVTIPYGETALDATNVALVDPAPFIVGLTSSHHTGVPGAAPKIDYPTEVANLPTIDVRSYGATGDGTTDDYAAIALAITAATALRDAGALPILHFPAAAGYATAAPVVVPHGITVVMDAAIVYTGSSDVVALTIGTAGTVSASHNHRIRVARNTLSTWSDAVELWRPSEVIVIGDVRRVGFRRYIATTGGTTEDYYHAADFGTGTGITDGTAVWAYQNATQETNIGVKLINLQSSDPTIARVAGFTIGAQFIGDGAGNVYNTVTLGELRDAKVALDLTSTNGGWCNENLFLGGRFWCPTSTNLSKSRYGVRITTQDGVYGNNNNNVFMKPSWELVHTQLTGSARSVGFLAEYASGNTARTARVESTSYAAQWLMDATGNEVELGYAGAETANTLDGSTSGSNFVSGVGETRQFLAFSASDLGSTESCPYSSTSVFVKGMSWITSSAGGAVTPTKAGENAAGTRIYREGLPWSAATPYSPSTGSANNGAVKNGANLYVCTSPGTSAGSGGPTGTGSAITDGTVVWAYAGPANVLSVALSRGVGVVVDTTNVKTWKLYRDCPSTKGGRVVVVCYDAAGAVLTGDAPSHVRGNGVTEFSQAGVSNDCYRTGADSNATTEFTVSDETKSAWVGVMGGTAMAHIRGLQLVGVHASRIQSARPGYAGAAIADRLVALEAPTMGTWAIPSVIHNDALAAGAPSGWALTVGGTPGTWKELAPVSL